MVLEFDASLLAGLIAVGLFTAISALWAISPRKKKPQSEHQHLFANHSNKAIFLFRDLQLFDANPAALTLIDISKNRLRPWDELCHQLGGIAKDVVADLSALAKNGTHFEREIEAACQTTRIRGDTKNGLVRIAISETPAEPTLISVEQSEFQALKAEISILREAVEYSPALAWKTDESGGVIWATKSYLDLLEMQGQADQIVDWPLPDLFDLKSAQSLNAPTRQSLTTNGTSPNWFEQTAHQSPLGGRLNFAIHADHVVKAEESLRNFVQTLTQTFAHLPIGLAIFDRNRQLALFNPALIDLTEIAPEWLSARPSLSAFLDQLRENRHIPEPKNYGTWRDRIADLEKAAIDGTYEENWPLPGGQTYRVIGRPHPEGAVAFLFEDISTELGLQRHFRSELDLSQSVIDSLPEALAVFSNSDTLVMSNLAFSRMWGVEPREMVSPLAFTDAVDLWRELSQVTPVWDDLHTEGPQGCPRLTSGETITFISGRTARLTTRPLPSGATLFAFRALTDPGVVARPVRLETA